MRAAWSKETAEGDRAFQVHAASKTEAERHAWKWVAQHKPGFAFNSVLPAFNVSLFNTEADLVLWTLQQRLTFHQTGPILCPEIFGSSMGYLRGLLDGNDFITQFLPPRESFVPLCFFRPVKEATLTDRAMPERYIDVRDDARIHVAALLDPQVSNQRLFACVSSFSWSDMIALLHKLRPNNTKIPACSDHLNVQDMMDIKPIRKAEDLIKRFFGVAGFVSLEDSAAAGIGV